MMRRSPLAVVAMDMPKFTRRKTKRQTRTWRRPETVAGPNVSLAIDDEIRAMKLQPRWSIDDALAFGRLAMRIALEDARYYEGRRASDELKYWKGIAASAREAELFLGRLLRQIGDKGLPTAILLARTRVSRSIAKSGVVFVGLVPRGNLSGGRYYTADDRRDQVARLEAARQLVREIITDADARCKQRQHTSKINDRRADYGKQAFVLRMVEAWIWLSGRKPGLGNLPEKNPCLRFVDAALLDAGIHNEKSAWRALEAALKWFDQMWMVPETLQTIASIGPDWADTFRATTNNRPVKG
jgi:hypothetical protein